MEFKDKIMLHCFRELKCQQGFTPEIRYQVYNVLGQHEQTCFSGRMVIKSDINTKGPRSFPAKGKHVFTFQF